MKKEVKEILKYLKKTTKENTTKEQFIKDLEKYDLLDILEAHSIEHGDKNE